MPHRTKKKDHSTRNYPRLMNSPNARYKYVFLITFEPLSREAKKYVADHKKRGLPVGGALETNARQVKGGFIGKTICFTGFVQANCRDLGPGFRLTSGTRFPDEDARIVSVEYLKKYKLYRKNRRRSG